MVSPLQTLLLNHPLSRVSNRLLIPVTSRPFSQLFPLQLNLRLFLVLILRVNLPVAQAEIRLDNLQIVLRCNPRVYHPANRLVLPVPFHRCNRASGLLRPQVLNHLLSQRASRVASRLGSPRRSRRFSLPVSLLATPLVNRAANLALSLRVSPRASRRCSHQGSLPVIRQVNPL